MNPLWLCLLLAEVGGVSVCLQAMFSLCMLESEADEVTLQGVTGVGLEHALDFAYTGQVSPSHMHLQAHTHAHKYTYIYIYLKI